MTRQLADKQTVFVEEYLIDLNATQAAIRAGYSANRASEIGYQLLQKTTVADAIAQAMAERSMRTQVTQDQVIRELARIGFSDMRRFARWDEDGVTMIPSDELSSEDAAAISEVSEHSTVKVTARGDGEKRVEERVLNRTLRFKLHSKTEALAKLAEHLGMVKNPSLNIDKAIVMFDLK